MEVLERYLKSILWWVLGASMFIGAVGEVVEDIFVGNDKIIALVVRLVETIVLTLINIVIIKKVAGRKEKGIKFKTYANTVIASVIVSAITWVVAFGLVQLKPIIGNVIIWGILSVLVYIFKVLLSFTIYVVILEDVGVASSIKQSIMLALKKENILRILLYNISFIVVLFVVNMSIKTHDTLFAVSAMEIANYLVLIANEILYLKCKETN